MERTYSEQVADLCYKIEDIFANQKAFNAVFFEATDRMYGIHAENQDDKVAKLRSMTIETEEAIVALLASLNGLSQLPDPFFLQPDPPSALNRAMSIAHLRIARRHIRHARVSAGLLKSSIESYIQSKNKNTLQKIRLYG